MCWQAPCWERRSPPSRCSDRDAASLRDHILNILQISDVFFPRVNGVSTAIATFRQELEACGHEVTVLAPAYGPAEVESGGAGGGNGWGPVARVPGWRVPFDPEDRLMRPAAARRRLDALDPRLFDVVHVHTPFLAHRLGVELKRRWGLPVVVTYHTYFEAYLHHYLPLVPERLLRLLVRRFSRRQCGEVDAVVAPSRAMEGVLRGYGVEGRVEVIPTGLRLEELAAGDGAAFRRRHEITSDRPVLVHIGRVAFEKNIGFLVEAVARVARDVPDVLLLIVGEGPAEPALRRRVRALGIERNVRFVGYLDRGGELLDGYRAGDIFVFASRTETQGLVLLEAMAMGVPVVATCRLGTREILEPRRGAVVVEEETPVAFAAAVTALLGDHERRRRLSAEARAFAATWSAARMTERLVALYRDVAR